MSVTIKGRKPLCVFCNRREAMTELAYDGAPLGPVCRAVRVPAQRNRRTRERG